jgi:hypothetical protein
MRAPTTAMLVLGLSVFSHAFGVTLPHRRRAYTKHDVTMSDAANLALTISTLSSEVQHFAQQTWHQYDCVLHKQPLETKMLTSALCAAVGDMVAQRSSAIGTFVFDPIRTLAFMAFGLSYAGAFQHFFFNFLNEVYAPEGPLISSLTAQLGAIVQGAAGQLSASAKAATNLLGAVPFVYMPLSLAFTAAVAGLDREAAIARAQSLYVPLLLRYYSFWIPVNCLAFYLIPAAFVIPFFSASSIVWNAILSMAGRQVQAQGVADMAALAETGVVFDNTHEPTVDEIMDAVRLKDVASTAEEALTPASLALSTAAIASVGLQAVSELEATSAAMEAIEAVASQLPVTEVMGTAVESL